MTLRLCWRDERYARVYCRDTIEWQALSWHAKALFMHLLRKADRRGYILLGRIGRRGIAALVGHPDLWPVLEGALDELEADGCVRVEGDTLVIDGFVAMQEAVSSGRLRTEKWREGKQAKGDETSPADDEASPGEEAGDETSQEVTRGYSTAKHGQAQTEQHGTPGAACEAKAVLEAVASLQGADLSRSFEQDLAAETATNSKREQRLLAALGDEWTLAADVADVVGRPIGKVCDDLGALYRRGVVEKNNLGSPPILHWRRKRSAA